MVIFNSYVKLPEGSNNDGSPAGVVRQHGLSFAITKISVACGMSNTVSTSNLAIEKMPVVCS